MDIKDILVIISALSNVVLAILLQRKSIATAEFSILEKTCERQRDEIQTLNQTIGQLKERTDLQPIMELLIKHNSESNNRFDTAINIQNLQSQQLQVNTEAVKSLVHSHEKLLKHLLPNHS